MDTAGNVNNNRYEIAAWVISGLSLLLVLRLNLLPALLSGFLVYELVHILEPKLRITRLSGTRAKIAAVSLLTVFIILVLALGVWELRAFLHKGSDSVSALLHKMAEIIEVSRVTLPEWLAGYLPDDVDAINEAVVLWLREHAGELQVMGREAGRIAAHILVGMVIGALVSLREIIPMHEYRPLARALDERVLRLGQAFRAVVFAQVRIASLNAIFAWLYLGLLLPISGVRLPLVKTMVAITFVTGLLPVVGNLISNTIIVIVSLSHSFPIALTSLVFLVLIHKLEYFLNARIVGSRIHAAAWELLLAMLVMEAAFGMHGLIAAPIYYAYLKRELTDQGLV